MSVGFARARERAHAHTTFIYRAAAHIHRKYIEASTHRVCRRRCAESAPHTADTLMLSATVWRTYVLTSHCCRASRADGWIEGGGRGRESERGKGGFSCGENRNRME